MLPIFGPDARTFGPKSVLLLTILSLFEQIVMVLVRSIAPKNAYIMQHIIQNSKAKIQHLHQFF